MSARRHLGNRAGAVGGAVDGFVVQDIQHAVSRLADVELDDVPADRERLLGGGEGVFRRQQARAPVADDLHGVIRALTISWSER